MDQLKYMKVWIIGGREQDCRLHFVAPTSKGGRTQSLSHASGVGGRFPLFAFESKLSTLTKKNALPTSLERRLCPEQESNLHYLAITRF